MRRARDVAVLALAAIPVGVVAIDVALHAQSVPWSDDWVWTLQVATKTADGTIRLGDLTHQYNDSRLFFTNLLTVANTRLTGWNLRAEMGFSLLLTVGSLALATSIYRRLNAGAGLFVALPFSLVLFSLTQRFRYVHAIDSAYAFLTFFLFVALWTITRPRPTWRMLVAAALACAAATFSYANGFLTWFVLAPLAWTAGYRKAAYLLAWAMAAGLALLLFFWGYRFRSTGGDLRLDPWFSSRFVLIFLGSPLTTRGGLTWDTVVGLVGLVGLAVNAIDLGRQGRPRREIAPWLSLAGFVLLSAAAISGLRGTKHGLWGALVDRYSTLASLFWIAYAALAVSAGGLAWRRFEAGRSSLVTVLANPVVAAVLGISLLVAEVDWGRRSLPVTPAHRECLLAVPSTGEVECLRPILPKTGTDEAWRLMQPHVAPTVRRLAELELNVFADP